MPISIPPDFFEIDHKPPGWEEDPDLRRAVDWFSSFISEEDWRRRRFEAFERFLGTATGEQPSEARRAGRFFVEADQFGWYLFLGQGWLEHPTYYDHVFGCRVIPLLRAIGRNLDLLKSVEGVEDRVRRMVGPEKSQPNGGLFELLVAAAYCREGGVVRFLPERPGIGKTHDMDVLKDGINWAVECKRMEVGEYTEREREMARKLLVPTMKHLQLKGHSVLTKVKFKTELFDLSPEYLGEHAVRWLKGGTSNPHHWDDETGSGSIKELDLAPLNSSLVDGDISLHGSRIMLLLTGKYKRNPHYVKVLVVHMGVNPLYVEKCDQALVMDWECQSEAANNGKARDVVKQLSKAVEQLPADRPGIVHIGMEAVEGDAVEACRFEKIKSSMAGFDPEGKPLLHVHVHWFAPENPPDAPDAFDETSYWFGNGPVYLRPLADDALVLEPNETSREGVHWDGQTSADA